MLPSSKGPTFFFAHVIQTPPFLKKDFHPKTHFPPETLNVGKFSQKEPKFTRIWKKCKIKYVKFYYLNDPNFHGFDTEGPLFFYFFILFIYFIFFVTRHRKT